MSLFYLIRHGETYANKLNIIQGTLDNEWTNLTIQGKREAQQYREILTQKKIDKVFVSPLKRAITTGKIICQDSNIPFQVDPRLSEISYGEWNGQKINILRENYFDYFDAITNDLKTNPSNINKGESFIHAKLRIVSFINYILKNYPKERMLVITHGWIIKTFVSLCFPKIDSIAFNNPSNLSLTEIKIEGDLNTSKIYYFNQKQKY